MKSLSLACVYADLKKIALKRLWRPALQQFFQCVAAYRICPKTMKFGKYEIVASVCVGY